MGNFIKSNIALYYSDNKGLLTTIREDMLSGIDPNWMNGQLSELPDLKGGKQSVIFNTDKKVKQKKCILLIISYKYILAFFFVKMWDLLYNIYGE